MNYLGIIAYLIIGFFTGWMFVMEVRKHEKADLFLAFVFTIFGIVFWPILYIIWGFHELLKLIYRK